MAITFETAYNTMVNRFGEEWNALTPVIVNGPAPEIRVAGIEAVDENGKATPPNAHFCRIKIDPVIQGQATLRNGEHGQRYRHEGMVWVQVFTVKTDNRAEELCRKLAEVAQNIFRGKEFEGCISFNNVRINSLEPEHKYNRRNMIAEYTFDEIA